MECRELLEGVCSRLVYCSRDMVVVETLVKRGVRVPRHSHEGVQATFVIRGRLLLGVEGRGAEELGPGSYRVIPPGVPHWAEALEDSLVVDVNAPATPDRLELARRLGAGCG
ncbi:cupin domain-containing protein [Pyrodictium occultum]|uniref:cupin domain-containing protein n=1 Tax=Pyrodictium occultum TaxID=2309 RepID=UPI0009F9B6D1|nr:cupin domain-containing protein [Pyrodictium occultum]